MSFTIPILILLILIYMTTLVNGATKVIISVLVTLLIIAP
jgi:hypothetical protein